MLILVKNIFKKRIKEIFMKPVLAGFTLPLILVPLIIISSFVTNYIVYNPVLYIFVNTLIIGGILSIIVWMKPTILGEYIQETIIRLFPKKKR